MQNDVMLLIIGAVVGFASAVIIELIKSVLERSRLKQEQKINAFLAREKDVKDFLSTEGEKKYPPAWLKLVATQNPIVVWRKMTGNPRQAGYIRVDPNSSSTSSPHSLKTAKLNESENEKFLESARSKRAINKYILGRTQILGRYKDCEIQLSDLSVSRLHAMIRCEAGNYLIYDLGSTSGTYLNGTKVDEMALMLFNSDVIVIGNSAFVFEKLATAVAANEKAKKLNKKSQNDEDIDGTENEINENI